MYVGIGMRLSADITGLEGGVASRTYAMTKPIPQHSSHTVAKRRIVSRDSVDFACNIISRGIPMKHPGRAKFPQTEPSCGPQQFAQKSLSRDSSAGHE